ncbi:MAG: hypothetical protein ACRD2C_13725 [Acidimicrobiales bacterium]
MTPGYWIVWRASVQAADPHALQRLERAVAFLRRKSYVICAEYDFDLTARTVVYRVTMEYTATRAVAIHRASRAIRYSLQRAGIGIPHGLPYTPAPAMRLVLDDWPVSARTIATVSAVDAVRS